MQVTGMVLDDAGEAVHSGNGSILDDADEDDAGMKNSDGQWIMRQPVAYVDTHFQPLALMDHIMRICWFL